MKQRHRDVSRLNSVQKSYRIIKCKCFNQRYASNVMLIYELKGKVHLLIVGFDGQKIMSRLLFD